MNTICGPYKRINNNFIYHLWHPRTESQGNQNFENNKKLKKQYAKRRGMVKAMKELIKERNG